MSFESDSYETRFRVLETLLIDVISDLTQKLSQLSDSDVFFLVESGSNGRRVAGSPNLCQSFIEKPLVVPNESEAEDLIHRETHQNTSAEIISIDNAPISDALIVARSTPRVAPARKRASSSLERDRRTLVKVRKLTSAVKIENQDHLEAVLTDDSVVGGSLEAVKAETVEEGIARHLDHFLNTSSKAEAIKQSSDPSIFAKSSVMYKLFSSLIWDFSKECAKILPFDDQGKPMFTGFAFDILWNFFPTFEFFDNSPSINSGGCFRSPRGFFKNMFCNRLKDQTTRKKR